MLFGMFSLFLRSRLYVGEACWAFICGIIIGRYLPIHIRKDQKGLTKHFFILVGPYCANIFDPRSLSHADDAEETANVITLEFTRIVLAIGVFAIGVELPKAYMLKHWKSLAALLVPVMTWVCQTSPFDKQDGMDADFILYFKLGLVCVCGAYLCAYPRT